MVQLDDSDSDEEDEGNGPGLPRRARLPLFDFLRLVAGERRAVLANSNEELVAQLRRSGTFERCVVPWELGLRLLLGWGAGD